MAVQFLLATIMGLSFHLVDCCPKLFFRVRGEKEKESITHLISSQSVVIGHYHLPFPNFFSVSFKSRNVFDMEQRYFF